MGTKDTFQSLMAKVPAETLAGMTSVAVARTPAKTVVFINGVQLPQSVNAISLPPGDHSLRVRIDGGAGDSGTGVVSQNGASLCTETALIPAGFKQAHSAEGRFNVV